MNHAPYGFVPIEEVYNVCTEWESQLDALWPRNDPPPSRDLLFSHMETLRFELTKRAKANQDSADTAAKRNPIAVKKDEKDKAAAEAAQAVTRDEWRRRTQLGRDSAKRDAAF